MFKRPRMSSYWLNKCRGNFARDIYMKHLKARIAMSLSGPTAKRKGYDGTTVR